MKETTPTFTTYKKWSIPSISPLKQARLCNGYVRENNLNKLKFPSVILELMIAYFTPNDKFTIQDVLKSPKNAEFQSYSFEIHGLSWLIFLSPNGRSNCPNDITWGLKCLSSLTQYTSIDVRLSIHTEQLYQMPKIATFKYGPTVNWAGFGNRNMTFKQLKESKLDQITIKLGFKLLDVIDKHGKNITHKFKKEKLIHQLEIEDLKLQLNDLNQQKHEFMDYKIIKNISNNKDRNELKYWLTNELKLPQYFGIFVSNGIEDLFTVKLINMNVLDEIGIYKIGHKLKILNFVDKLKQNNNYKANKNTIGIKRPYQYDNNNNDNQPPLKKKRG